MSTNLQIANVANAETTEQMVFHHTDHLSGTSIDTDANGNVIESVDYYPYGEIRIDDKTTTYENKHKFTGKELDESVNLYYYGARYYDPSIGRFISADPVDGDLSNPQSLNKYSYVMNNPLKYVDVTGNMAEYAMIAGLSLGAILTAPLSVLAGGGAAIITGILAGIAIYEESKALSAKTSVAQVNTNTQAKERTNDENNYITLYRGDDPGKNGFLANGLKNGNIFPEYLGWSPGEDLAQSLIDRHRKESKNSLFISTTMYEKIAEDYAIGEEKNKIGMVYELKIPKNQAYSTGKPNGEYLVPLIITGDKIVSKKYVYPKNKVYKK